MSVIVGSTRTSGTPSSSREPRLDLLIENWASEQPRPAWMRSPVLEVRRDCVDDLPVEVEAEVVTGCKVGEPAVADADHPTVDLLDDSVAHSIRALELGQVRARVKPATDPVVGRTAPQFPRADRSHVGFIGLHARWL